MKIKIISLDETGSQPLLKVEVTGGKKNKVRTFHILVGDNFNEENLKGIVKREMEIAEQVDSGTELAKSLVGKEIKL